jgi:hypothetical protein
MTVIIFSPSFAIYEGTKCTKMQAETRSGMEALTSALANPPPPPSSHPPLVYRPHPPIN